jgi:site-specific DNA recombinase
LRGQGIVTRKRLLSSGQTIGGVTLTNGPLVHLLRNRMYRGELNHRDKSYPGEHQPIIEEALFDRVQAKLSGNRRGNRLQSQRSEALLLGKLFDDRGNKMTPSYAIKKGVRYPFYVSCVLAEGRKEEAGSVSRVGADAIETIVLDALAGISPSTEAHHQQSRPSSTTIADPEHSASFSHKKRIEGLVERIVIGAQSVEIRLADDPDLGGRPKVIAIPWSPKSFRRKSEVIEPTDAAGSARPIRAEARTKLLAAIAKGRRWLEQILSGEAADIEAIAAREGLTERSTRMTLSLAFLAPDIVKAAVNGTLPRGFGVSRLTELPAAWMKQREALGLMMPT